MPSILVFLLLSLPLVAAYAMYAVGIVVIYRSSRVLNLAHGAMAVLPAYLVYTLVERARVPIGIALPLGVAAGALLGVAIERAFVRRLRDAGPTAQTVGTVAAFGLVIALTARIWGTGGLEAPRVFPEGGIGIGSSMLQTGQLGLLGVAVVSVVLLQTLFGRTWLGLVLRGAADNRRAARLLGVDPDRASAVAWALGGALAAVAGILLAAVTALHPLSLSLSVLPAFVAALIGGLRSLPGALAGAGVVGVVIGIVPVLADVPGLGEVVGRIGGAELALALAAMVVMAARGGRLAGVEAARPTPPRAPASPPIRFGRLPAGIGLAVAAGWVFLPGVPFTFLTWANEALLTAIVVVSLVLLIGWVGQISLAQAAFVGVGAFASVQFANRLGLPFPLTIPAGALIAAAAAAALGTVALRVRGLYLAVATLIFAWMADQYLFTSPWLVGAGGSATVVVDPIGYEGGFPWLDPTQPRVGYLIALAGVALVVVGLANLRRAKTGRAFLAVRDSELNAASLGIDVARTKLLAFALSGGIAGMAGTLVAAQQGTIVPAQFGLTASLFAVSVVVVGGVRSLDGAIAASAAFAGLNELFFRVDALHGWIDVVVAGSLAAVLLFYPGGLAAAGHRLAARGARLGFARAPRAEVTRRALVRPLAQRFGAEVRGAGREVVFALDGVLAGAERRARGTLRTRIARTRAQVRGLRHEARSVGTAARATGARIASVAREQRPAARERVERIDALTAAAAGAGPALQVFGLTVRFGGVTAVEDADLRVETGEIVGLIGPNGAGKTATFNAIAGVVEPAAGRVVLFGEDVTGLPVHARAARGLARTFQQPQIAGGATVEERLLVATHLANPSGLPSDLAITNLSARAERRARERVRLVASLVGLDDVLERDAGGLPFGTLRLVELAQALATGGRVLMLDEPASGLDQAETAALGRLLLRVRQTLGVSILLIEHDMAMVNAICDRITVLDRGRVIAEGTPRAVRGNERVVEAYLGRAAARV